MRRRLHQQFESYKEQVQRIGVETRRPPGQHKDDTPTCGICRKTKFADGCGHLCSYCQTKFCARCGGRVSLRSNNPNPHVALFRDDSLLKDLAPSVNLAMGIRFHTNTLPAVEKGLMYRERPDAAFPLRLPARGGGASLSCCSQAAPVPPLPDTLSGQHGGALGCAVLDST
ncbi:hypothetical protein COCON_G00037680 [Conger conger]|uniref:RIM zinc finger domain-containing protein n=1 Tax=Conger conger TaxID=82655 RepID=A0A9Q1E005_CONCO|nr:hypothetical protein COCON_G00037680 [Conger conger]